MITLEGLDLKMVLITLAISWRIAHDSICKHLHCLSCLSSYWITLLNHTLIDLVVYSYYYCSLYSPFVDLNLNVTLNRFASVWGGSQSLRGLLSGIPCLHPTIHLMLTYQKEPMASTIVIRGANKSAMSVAYPNRNS